MKDLFDKNFKSLKKEIKNDLRSQKDLPCLWIGRINIVKMAILPNTIYSFNAIPIKIPTQLFIGLERAILKFIWNNNNNNNKKKNRTAKSVLKKKRTSVGISVPYLKQWYRAKVIKTTWYWWLESRSRELNWRTKNVTTHLWSLDLWQRNQNHPVENRYDFQWVVLVQLALSTQHTMEHNTPFFSSR